MTAPSVTARLRALEARMRAGRGANLVWADELAAVRAECESIARDYRARFALADRRVQNITVNSLESERLREEMPHMDDHIRRLAGAPEDSDG